jgi:hypothetical protein
MPPPPPPQSPRTRTVSSPLYIAFPCINAIFEGSSGLTSSFSSHQDPAVKIPAATVGVKPPSSPISLLTTVQDHHKFRAETLIVRAEIEQEFSWMGPFWDHNHEDYEYDYQVARYGKLGQKVAGWVDAVEQAMGSGKQGSKPALSAACTAWKAPFLPIVYHAFCVIPAAAMVELHWLEKSDSMIRHKNANGVDITVTVGTLARRAKNWSLNAKSKGKNAKVMWDMIRPEVMEPISLNRSRY